MLDTGRNTIAVPSAHKPATHKICEKKGQMKIDLGLILKHVIGGTEKVNMVNYFSKTPPPTDEYYYDEDSYVVNNQTGFTTKCPRLQLGKLAPRLKKPWLELW